MTAPCPELLRLGERALSLLEAELRCLLESGCLIGENRQPLRDTLDAPFEEEAQALEREIAETKAILARSRGAA